MAFENGKLLEEASEYGNHSHKYIKKFACVCVCVVSGYIKQFYCQILLL